MYPFFGIILAVLLISMCIHFYRKRCIIKKIKCMSPEEKCKKLNQLIEPFGYSYDHCQDVFGTTLHPWQRTFGYGQIYDKAAPHFQMIIDCLPVYFDYHGSTWLIELWKGQYGINTGCEVGIYKADGIVPRSKRPFEIFKAVSDDELLMMSIKLRRRGAMLACYSKLHWWLTAFKVGCFSKPKELSMSVSITFRDSEMLNAFCDGLAQSKFPPETVYINGLTASFTFDTCTSCQKSRLRKCYLAFVQWKNYFHCKLFLCLTRTFTSSMDRVLYLYEYAPFAFRKMFSIHHYNASSKKKRL